MVNNRAFGRWRNPPRLPGMNSAPWNLDYDPAYYDYNYNYNLDDNEIADIVVDTLNSNPYIYRPDKESIVVDVKDSVVTLSGKVKNKRSKYLAYADAFWCSPAVLDVDNQIKITKKENNRQPK